MTSADEPFPLPRVKVHDDGRVMIEFNTGRAELGWADISRMWFMLRPATHPDGAAIRFATFGEQCDSGFCELVMIDPRKAD